MEEMLFGSPTSWSACGACRDGQERTACSLVMAHEWGVLVRGRNLGYTSVPTFACC